MWNIHGWSYNGKEPLKEQCKVHPSFFLIQYYFRRARGDNENKA